MISQATATESVESCLRNIGTLDSELHAIITVADVRAREDARRCDQATDRGEWLGLLHGMPIAIKDNIDTEGVLTTSGSRFFATNVPSLDATVVQRLRAAGAIPIAKANMAEFAFGATSQNDHYGGCRNPWDLDRIPGGSSGGSGVAVAAEMAVAALGTDTGGSVRIPAAMNGIVGMRPTFGRVSNHGVLQVSRNFDTVGPLARRAVDVARVMAVLDSFDNDDVTSLRGSRRNVLDGLSHGIEGLRFGVPVNHFTENLHPEVRKAFEDALRVIEELGGCLVDITVKGAEEAQTHAQRLIYPDIAAFHAGRIADAPELFGPSVLARIRLGQEMTATEYAASQSWRLEWVRVLENLFETVDLIVSPTVPIPTPRISELDMTTATHAVTTTTYPWSISNMPSLSTPCGFAEGTPVGLHISARPWADHLVLRAAVAFQSVTDWHLREAPVLQTVTSR